jgi:hypothetical protein
MEMDKEKIFFSCLLALTVLNNYIFEHHSCMGSTPDSYYGGSDSYLGPETGCPHQGLSWFFPVSAGEMME